MDMKDGEGRSLHDHVEDETAAELRESAYRRGFHQALSEVEDALKNGVRYGEIAAWLGQVDAWRFREGRHDRPRDFVERPPAPPWYGRGDT
jgi:hypothetical protein